MKRETTLLVPKTSETKFSKKIKGNGTKPR